MLKVFSWKLKKVLQKSGLFSSKICYFSICRKGIASVLCWKYNRKKSINYAKKHNIPLIQIEDAFVGYLENTQGKMVNIGMYYDITGGVYYSSDEENIITHTLKNKEYTQDDLKNAGKLIEKIVKNKITKYNKILQPSFKPHKNCAKILVIDQVYNDASIKCNNHGLQEFQAMYNSAIQKANGKKIYIKTHPNGNGYLHRIAKENEAIMLTDDYNIFDILQYTDEVYTVSSQAGFEALLAGKKVYTFGTPFYSGYGLTIDNTTTKRQNYTIEELFFASYIKACRYFIVKIECNLNEIIDVIITHKNLAIKNRTIQKMYFYQIPLWKMYTLKSFIFQKNVQIVRVKNFKEIQKKSFTKGDKIILWGFKASCNKIYQYAKENNISIITFEDGFIRSVGLGSDFVPPYSLVMDSKGIYYNPKKTSQLEHIILHNQTITPEQKERVENFIVLYKEMQISKYNIVQQNTQEEKDFILQRANKKKIILITGQVSDDMSIIYGATKIQNYSHLVREVRKNNPSAFIIYKHHPDVIASNRNGYIESEYLLQYVDCITQNLTSIDAIQIADEIHTITSTIGFEALLYGKKVVHYGMPFYGGYGFTDDKSEIRNKRNVVDFNTFCYAALFLYPYYTQNGLKIALTPEIVIKLLAQDKLKKQKKLSLCERRIMQCSVLISLYCKEFVSFLVRN